MTAALVNYTDMPCQVVGEREGSVGGTGDGSLWNLNTSLSFCN